MKKLLSALLILALSLALLSATAFAAGNPELSKYSDAEIKQMYEAFRDEMVARGMPLAAQITLKEGKFIVGEDILPGSYTIKCTETFGDTYGDLYSSLGGMFNDELGGLMGSLGGMMSDIVNAQVVILGDYGSVIKSFELSVGESTRITLTEGTALQISDGSSSLGEGTKMNKIIRVSSLSRFFGIEQESWDDYPYPNDGYFDAHLTY